MDSRTLNRITLYIAAVGAVLSGGAFLTVGGAPAVGTLVGAVVAVANWLAMRWVIGRVAQGSARTRGLLMVLLVLKMGALVALCWMLIVRFNIHALGFTVGVSSLVLGLLLGATSSATRSELEDGPAAGPGHLPEEQKKEA